VETVLVTGANGMVGGFVVPGIADRYRVRSFDVVPGAPAGVGPEDAVVGDLLDPGAVREAVRGVTVVVHLAAIGDEAPYPDILRVNLLGSYHLLEAARLEGCRRVVLASTNRVTGGHPRSDTVDPSSEFRPDTFYAAGKIGLEGLGRLYADRFGVEIVALRIGTLRARPESRRALSTWLSPADAVRLFVRAIEAPVAGFTVVYGVSANSRAFWRHGGETIGYVPEDDAEAYAGEVGSADTPWPAVQGQPVEHPQPDGPAPR
jgi:uronate dehydrogenase